MSDERGRPFSEIPGPSTFEMMRLMPKAVGAVGEVMLELVERYGPVVAMPIPGREQVVLGGPEEIGRVMDRERHRFLKKTPTRAFAPLGEGDPFTEAGGEGWEKARRAHPMDREAVAQLLERATPRLTELIRGHARRWAMEGEQRAWRALCRLGFDFLCELTLGHSLSTEIYEEFRWITELIDDRMNLDMLAGAPPIWPKHRAEALLDRLGEEAARALREDPEGPHLLAFMGGEGIARPPRESGRMLLAILLAGGISSPAGLLWTLLRLEESPGVGARLDADPSLLEGVIRESLRLHPPVSLWMRRVADEGGVELGGYHLPEGTRLWIGPRGLQRDPEAWPEPERFWPERWTEDLLRERPFGSGWFFPFGRGARSCVGQEAALLFLRLGLRTLREEGTIRLSSRHIESAYFFGCSYPKGARMVLVPKDRGRRPPSLPQEDPDPVAREAQLREVASQYAIDLDKLPPLALCEGVPRPERASMRWFIEAGKVATPIVANMAAVRVELVKTKASLPTLTGSSSALGGELTEAVVGKAMSLLGKLGNEDPGKLDELHHKALPLLRALGAGSETSLREKVDDTLRFILSGGARGALGTFEEDKPIYAYRTPGSSPRGDSVGDFEDLHRYLPIPEAGRELFRDRSFARRRITGPNPALLRRIEALPDALKVSDEVLSRALSAGDTVEAAAAEGRLYLLDHSPLLTALEPSDSSRGEPMYLYGPMSLFALPRGGRELLPVAIRCAPEPRPEAPLLTPADGWAWRMARYVVEVADMCWFESITHLGLTHLLLEPAAIATRRFLAPNHPLSLLLRPHFEGTISVNDMAIHNLAADEGAIDQTFGATIASIRGAAAAAAIAHDLRGDTLPARLARLGLDDRERLPDHPFRDDSLRVRGAIEGWVRAYLGHAYRAEGSLAADPELAAWARALAGPQREGGIRGFGRIGGLTDLVEVVTEMIFIASAGHAAVNFAQWSECGFAPRMSGGVWAPAPTSAEGYTEADWLAMLPPLDRAELSVEFLFLLGNLYYSRLGHYEDPDGVEVPWMTDPRVREELLPAFQRELVAVEEAIEADNADPARRATPYLHLRPSRIPQSVNV